MPISTVSEIQIGSRVYVDSIGKRRAGSALTDCIATLSEWNVMEIDYLNPDLHRLNDKLRRVFSGLSGLSSDEIRVCRWGAMDMLPSTTGLTEPQRGLAAQLTAVVEFARSHNLDGVVGWCMAASADQSIADPGFDIDGIIRDFVTSHVPSPARIVDVAAGTGRCSLPLARHGYQISLFEPASAFLEAAYESVKIQGVEGAIAHLICGTFEDLSKINDDAYDASICLASVLYAHPRRGAEDVLANLARISSRGVVVDVASKYGLLLQLGAEGAEVSASSIKEFLSTGVSPPASAENGRVVYSSFSSTELRARLNRLGLRIEGLVGYGIPGTLDDATARLLPAGERDRIEEYLQAEDQAVDLFPNILALCVKE